MLSDLLLFAACVASFWLGVFSLVLWQACRAAQPNPNLPANCQLPPLPQQLHELPPQPPLERPCNSPYAPKRKPAFAPARKMKVTTWTGSAAPAVGMSRGGGQVKAEGDAAHMAAASPPKTLLPELVWR